MSLIVRINLSFVPSTNQISNWQGKKVEEMSQHTVSKNKKGGKKIG
jgi:hypothetical protein